MNTLESTKEEWRELGFHYDRDDKRKFWIITGSKTGLQKFVEILEDFGTDLKNDKLFEHNHYGPYSFLKVITVYGERGFNGNAIFGELNDMIELGKIIRQVVLQSKVGEKKNIKDQYSPDSEYDFFIKIENDSFDPPSIDEWILEQEKKLTKC